MKKFIPIIILIIIINFVSYPQQALAINFTSQYIHGASNNYSNIVTYNDTNDLQVTIHADRAAGHYPNNIIFIGNVHINQGNRYLLANKVSIYQIEDKNTTKTMWIVNALDNIYYYDNQTILKGSKGLINLNTKDIDIWEGDYQIVNSQIHGKAHIIKQRDENRYTILKHGSLTSCISGDIIWNIIGSKILYDREEQIIKIWNARLKLGNIPIFYSPYLRLPIGNKRRSGFLIPNIKYSTSNYLELFFPYYWKIASDMGITITPCYTQKYNNIMWKNELQYLTNSNVGFMEINYLSSNNNANNNISEDKLHVNKLHDISNRRNYWLFYWRHIGTLSRAWKYDIDYTKVSNSDYFNKFNYHSINSTDLYTIQKFHASHTVGNFTSLVSIKQFQTLNCQSSKYYAAKPQIDINWHSNNIGPFYVNIYTQGVRFVHKDTNMPKTIRLHLESSVNLPLVDNFTSLNTEVKLITTHYQQRNVDWYNTTHGVNLKKSVNRILPQFKMIGKMNFYRDLNKSKGFVQTLEPCIQYLYIPYRNQSSIKNYDSYLLQDEDYSDLFRDRLYSGFDRIASVNKLISGIKGCIYDNEATERLNISIGQIYYLNGSYTGDINSRWEKNYQRRSPIWTGDIYWRINNNWNIRYTLKYDTHLHNISTSNSIVEYHCNKNNVMYITYRYFNQKHIPSLISKSISDKYKKGGISQIGGTINWSIANHWFIEGNYNIDTNVNKPINQSICLQYNSCCYAINISYEYKLRNLNINNDKVKYDKIIGFSIELRGLKADHNPNKQSMLRSSNISYYGGL